MFKKVSAMKARQNLGQVLNEVALRGDDYIVERAGKPIAAIISLEKYQSLQEERDSALQALDQIWGKMKDENPKVVEDTIDEAVKNVRKV